MNKRLSACKECHYFKLRNTCYVRVLVSLHMTCITIRTGACNEEILRAITSWLLFVITIPVYSKPVHFVRGSGEG